MTERLLMGRKESNQTKQTNGFYVLKTYSDNSHSCVGKQVKLSGSSFSIIYEIDSIQFLDTLMSNGYHHIFLTNTVTIKCVRNIY